MKPWFTFDKSSLQQAETERLVFWCGIALFAFFVCWAIFFVPMNNDEANHYHFLACINNPFSWLDASQMRGCDHRYDITTPFGFVIPRSLPYIGLFPSLIYAPVYFLFHSAIAQYIFGLGFFVAFAFMISAMTKKPQLTFPIILSFLPLSFHFIHDMGPVKFAFLMFPLSVWFSRRAVLASSPNNFFYAVILASLLFCGVEEKPFFFYLLPGLMLFVLAFLGESFNDIFERLFKSWRVLLIGLIAFMALLTVLLFSKLQNGNYYITELIIMMHGQEMYLPNADPGFNWVERWLRFLLFWPYYFHRFFDLDLIDDYGNLTASFGGFVSMCFLPVILFLSCFVAIFAAYKKREIFGVSSRTILLSASFFATILTFAVLGTVWAGHHFIFIWIPLLVLFSDLLAKLRSRWLMYLMLLFYVINVLPWLYLSTMSPLAEVSDDRRAISAYFDDRRSENSIINYPTVWGYHLIQSLYGPTNQLIVRVAKYEETMRILKLAATTHRDIFYVCYKDTKNMWVQITYGGCSKEQFEKILSADANQKVVLDEVLPGLKTWHVYRVVLPNKK